MAEEVGFLFVAPAVVGIVISILEIIFVMQDEGGMHPLSHALHAVPVAIILTYVSMWAVPIGNILSESLGWTFLTNSLVAQIVIAVIVFLVATAKVKAAAAIVGGHGSVGEKLPHAIIIGLLIAAAPFYWPLIAAVAPFLNR